MECKKKIVEGVKRARLWAGESFFLARAMGAFPELMKD